MVFCGFICFKTCLLCFFVCPGGHLGSYTPFLVRNNRFGKISRKPSPACLSGIRFSYVITLGKLLSVCQGPPNNPYGRMSGKMPSSYQCMYLSNNYMLVVNSCVSMLICSVTSLPKTSLSGTTRHDDDAVGGVSASRLVTKSVKWTQ